MALFFSTVTTIVCTIHLLMTINDRATDAQLRRAAGSKCLEALKEAVQGWTAEEIDGMANDGKSALHMAAWKGSLENVKYLIETLGCDINIFSKQEFSYGKTPIFFAATQSRQDVLEYLLSKGVKVAIVNNKGQSVLSIASSHDMPASVLEQIRHLETRQKNDWWNFRESHSDGFEYGE